ncbi:hypothetical protein BBJ28_00016177 [Nothophytophthora sp. Chile5]|nr:hypothetical protein BBJ28_00016177 [Nothophytophthora sp. Chile5]
MEAIAAAYGSSSESSDDEPSTGDEAKPVPTVEPIAASDAPVGAKRKRSEEPQWARAFPHVEGNWPSHVRISIRVNQQMRELARAVIECVHELVGDSVALVPFEGLKPGDGMPSAAAKEEAELHLSLSRPFVLTFTQIDGFVDALRAALKWRQRCVTLMHNYPTWVRPDLTAAITHASMTWPQLSGDAAPSACDPIPHVSIASSIGEELTLRLTPDQCEDLLSPRGEQQQQTTSNCFTTGILAIHVVIGNKHYDIPLQ